jgi:hypothetical protein
LHLGEKCCHVLLRILHHLSCHSALKESESCL